MATVKKKEDIFAPTPYNPLDKRNLGESVAGAMLKSEIHIWNGEDCRLRPRKRFEHIQFA